MTLTGYVTFGGRGRARVFSAKSDPDVFRISDLRIPYLSPKFLRIIRSAQQLTTNKNGMTSSSGFGGLRIEKADHADRAGTAN